jgi:nucleoside-diphosphate-sugar epimerase
VHLPPRGFDERFKQAGIARARELLGWEPRVHIEEGMRRLMETVGSPAR